MKFSFLLPHLNQNSITRSIVDLSNKLVELHHDVTLYHSDGSTCSWSMIRAKIQAINKVHKVDHDYIIFTTTAMYPVYKDIFKRGYCRQGVLYVLNNELLFEDDAITREAYLDPALWKVASSTWVSQQIENIIGSAIDVVPGGVDPNIFFKMTNIEKKYPLLTKGIGSEYWRGMNFFNEACVLLQARGYSLQELNPDQSKISLVYNSAEFFINTSFFEGWGANVLEAMACGVPVITTDDGGIRDFVEHGRNAFVIPTGSSLAIKLAVNTLTEKPELAETIVSGGLETAKKYTWERSVSKFIEVLNSKSGRAIKKIQPQEKQPINRTPEKGYLVDVIVPVYNSLKHTKACINSIIQNTTDIKYRLIIVDDNSDTQTVQYLTNVSKFAPYVEIIRNDTNLGYLRSVNKGLQRYRTPYKVSLNSDTVVPKGWLQRLIAAAESDSSIGLVVPLSSNGGTLTIKIPQGSNYQDTDKLVEMQSKKLYPEACTIIAYCLLITQETIDNIGVFDDAYDPGYYEECDYQYKAREAGFRAVICDNLYLYHKGKGSFGDRKEELLKKNRVTFHQRWDKYYLPDFQKYEQDNVLGYLRDKKTQNVITNIPHVYDVVFVLPSVDALNSFVISVVDLANGLLQKGLKTSIAIIGQRKIDLDSYISPILFSDIKSFFASNYKSKVYVATHNSTVEPVIRMALNYNAKPVYLIQDFEGYLDNTSMQYVIETYAKIKDKIVTTPWLVDRLDSIGHKAVLLPMGVDTDIFYNRLPKTEKFSVVGISRQNGRKGFKDLKTALTILKNLDPSIQPLLIGTTKDVDFPYLGNLTRDGVANVLSTSSVAIDTSIQQGTSLFGLEAMACGCAFLTTRSLGVDAYCVEGENTLYSNVNDPFAIALNILKLKNEKALYKNLVQNGYKTAETFSIYNIVDAYMSYFIKLLERKLNGNKS